MPGSLRTDDVFFNSGLLLPLFCLCALYMLAGCSKSADELYANGQRMVLDERTFDKGMKALISFQKNYPDDPRVPEVALAIATALQNNGDIPAAEAAYMQLLDSYPDTDEAQKGLFLLGYMYYDHEDYQDKARDTLTRFVEKYPDSELTSSAQTLIENIGRPVDEWTVMRNIDTEGP